MGNIFFQFLFCFCAVINGSFMISASYLLCLFLCSFFALSVEQV